ncbi:hypothetical protein ABK040_013077 [Willaertia magna]
MNFQTTKFLLIIIFIVIISITTTNIILAFTPDKCPTQEPGFVHLKCKDLFEKFNNVQFVSKTTALTNENGWCCFQQEVKYLNEFGIEKSGFCIVKFHPNLRIAPIALWSTLESKTC